ncbi:MAG: transketolase C-terminal domain-containing protein [Spirochaetales bacterium]|nr:transketolase C-terminal domain-containing protein [Spirochaetales bacterium]
METEACGSAFSKLILEKAKKDKDVIVVCTDSRGSSKLGDYPQEVPEQFVEMGIAEQNAVTVSAGMAHIGKKVFVMGPASFYSTRSSEQVKVDVAYSRNNVAIIGISGGISYGALGATHHSLQDISFMRAIPNLAVEIPSDATQMRAVTEELVENGQPIYIRIARNPVPVLYKDTSEIKIGKANRWFSGKDAAIIACGQLVANALDAAELLKKEGIEITVVDMHTIKPLDTDMIKTVSEECGCILTLEEHSIYGGLGGAVSEFISQNIPIPMQICGIPDEDIPNGTDKEIFKYYGLNAEGIVKRIRNLIAMKKNSKNNGGK